MEDFKDSPRITREFILNEVREYTELTGLIEFSIEGHDELLKLTVSDGEIHVTYESEVLYEGTVDGTEGAMSDKYFSDRLFDLGPIDNAELRVHADFRRLVMNINSRAKQVWNERIILTCDYEEMVTRIDGKVVGISYSHDGVQLRGAMNYPLEMTLKNGKDEYLLSTDWGSSFVIYKIVPDENSPVSERVDELILPGDHAALRFITTVDGYE